MELKGQVDKKFHQHHQPAGKNKRPTEYKQVSTVQVAQQDDHCRDNNACRPHHRKSKGKEPTPTGGQIDIQQVNPQRHKIDRDKDDGIPPAEPQRQYDNDVAHQQRTRHITRPYDSAIDTPIAQQADNNRQYRQHRHYKECAAAAHFLVEVFLRRVRPVPFGRLHLRVKDRGAAQRAFFLTVAQLHTAFNTIHSCSPLGAFSARCFPPLPAGPSSAAPHRNAAPAPAPGYCGSY